MHRLLETHARRFVVLLLWACLGCLRIWAVDPPHTDGEEFCSNCHLTHQAPAGSLTSISGNANLCQSCHLAGGQASTLALPDSQQAVPWPGLPAGTNASGTSHRWDSSASGRVVFLGGAAVPSAGTLLSGGAFTGPYARTFTITITAGGGSGTALFNWTATMPGGGGASSVLTGTNVPLGEGITATFANGPGVSFQPGDQWDILVRTDLRDPTNAAMALKLVNGSLMCSTCHDQHSQAAVPFGENPPAYDPATGGVGRHYMRIDNSRCDMCVECHTGRSVTNALAGSHPVGVGADQYACTFCHNFHVPYNPQSAPLGPDHEIDCLTCHQMHFSPATNGMILVATNINLLCTKCHHSVADTTTPAAHLNRTNSGTLWPGGQYGSACPPKTDSAQRGTCVNCHQPHGWPDAANPSNHYPVLLVDQEEAFCYTCHDADGPAKRGVMSEFSKVSSHPVAMTSGVHHNDEPAVVTSRHVECVDCHEPHMAKLRVNLPGPATTPRPASGPLAGVLGVSTSGATVDPAAYEYQVCYRCHADSPGQPAPATLRQFTNLNVRLEFSGSLTSAHPVTVRSTNPYVPSLIGGWTTNSIMACTDCHNNNAGPNNGGTGPNGPHGSTNAALLERVYVKADNTSYAQANYALCFKCHSATSIMGDISFHEHTKHIVGEGAPCNVCHDPHASAGQFKLINFDTSVVAPSQTNGKLEYKSTGRYSGECSLTCHGQDHNPYSYHP